MNYNSINHSKKRRLRRLSETSGSNEKIKFLINDDNKEMKIYQKDNRVKKFKKITPLKIPNSNNEQISPFSLILSPLTSPPRLFVKEKLNEFQLSKLFDDTVTMAVKDKINEDNTWNIRFIDYIQELIDTERINHNDVTSSSSLFQRASSSIETGIKIYSSRVDSVQNQMFKLLNSVYSREETNEKEDQQKTTKKAKKNKSPLSEMLIKKDKLSAINLSENDYYYSTDPLLHVMSSVFDEGSNMGFLTDKLKIDENCSYKLDYMYGAENDIHNEEKNTYIKYKFNFNSINNEHLLISNLLQNTSDSINTNLNITPRFNDMNEDNSINASDNEELNLSLEHETEEELNFIRDESEDYENIINWAGPTYFRQKNVMKKNKKKEKILVKEITTIDLKSDIQIEIDNNTIEKDSKHNNNNNNNNRVNSKIVNNMLKTLPVDMYFPTTNLKTTFTTPVVIARHSENSEDNTISKTNYKIFDNKNKRDKYLKKNNQIFKEGELMSEQYEDCDVINDDLNEQDIGKDINNKFKFVKNLKIKSKQVDIYELKEYIWNYIQNYIKTSNNNKGLSFLEMYKKIKNEKIEEFGNVSSHMFFMCILEITTDKELILKRENKKENNVDDCYYDDFQIYVNK